MDSVSFRVARHFGDFGALPSHNAMHFALLHPDHKAVRPHYNTIVRQGTHPWPLESVAALGKRHMLLW